MAGWNREHARAALRHFLRSIENQARWWFVLKLPSEDPNSFASLLSLTDNELEKLMVACEFYREKDLAFRKDEFLSVLDSTELDIELDACMIKSLGMNKAHVIRVGSKVRLHVDYNNARQQFADPLETEARRPRLRGMVNWARFQLRSSLDSLLFDDGGKVKEEDEEDEEEDEEKEADIEDPLRLVLVETIKRYWTILSTNESCCLSGIKSIFYETTSTPGRWLCYY